ncbi:hypothetical protein [Cryobacterium sp. GrIS_2_6]|uniref:hypothetical protein n=1 Tax=Cryobacterium sp. GrIS_2_6 TaxID=3162785 RepID=UPI002DFB9572|nr:hypothetical protein [Cryobacterium psychrotolerans]
MSYLLNPTQWAQQHDAIYARHAWPAGTAIAVTGQRGHPDKGQRGQLYTVGFADVHDAAAIWALIEQPASKGHNSWVSVGGLNRAAITKGRGKADDVVGMPALIADVDFATGVHAKGGENPTKAEAKGWLDAMPMKPTLVNLSGGGAHVWVTLSEILDHRNPVHADLLQRWKAWWLARAAQDDKNVDAGPLADPARILRPAGTWNPNQDQPVTLQAVHPERTYSIAELLDVLPPLPESSLRTSRPTEPRKAVPTTSRTLGSGSQIGTEFAAAYPVSTLVEDLFDAEPDGWGGYTFGRPDGTVPSATNARTYDDRDQPQRITIFSESVKEGFGITGPHSYSSWDVLGAVVHRGDFKAAARLLSRTREADGSWGTRFLDAAKSTWTQSAPTAPIVVVESAPSPTDDEANVDDTADDAVLAKLLGGALSPGGVVSITSIAEVESPTLTVAQAVASHSPTEFRLDGNLAVRYAPNTREHGVFTVRKEKNDAGIFADRYTRVTSWIAWRTDKVEFKTVNALGRTEEIAPPKYTVEIIDAAGRTTRREGFSAEESIDPTTLVLRMDTGTALPTGTTDTRQFKNSLIQLGHSDGSTKVLTEYSKLGWLFDERERRWAFLAPAGSVTADGPTSSYTVGPPAGSEAGALRPAQLELGWPQIPQDRDAIRAAAKSVTEFFSTSKNHRITTALLGVTFAGPLALSSRTTVFIVANPGSAKSLEVGCAQAFISGVFNGKQSTAGGLGQGTSEAGAGAVVGWGRHLATAWDDFRDQGSRIANERMRMALTVAIQSAYGSDDALKGTAAGGLRAARDRESAAIMTGEGLPSGEGITGRVIAVPLANDDILREPRGSSPVDLWRTNHAAGARAIFGAYLQWLAGRLTELGDLPTYRRWNDAAKNRWKSSEATRTVETVATLAAGWARFREFAQAKGFEDLLPEQTFIDEQLSALAVINTETTARSNPSMTITLKARDIIANGAGHLECANASTVPSPGVAQRIGWQYVAEPIPGLSPQHWRPTLRKIGVLTPDLKFVVLTNDAVTRIKRELALDTPDDQIVRGFAELVKPGTTPGGRHTFPGYSSRPRGYMLPVDLLDLDGLREQAAGEWEQFEKTATHLVEKSWSDDEAATGTPAKAA